MQNGTLLQYFHWYCPADGSLWNKLKADAKKLVSLGITAAWLPPAFKANAGGMSVGYDVYDIYDLGEFDQKGSIRTKYGTKQEYLTAVKAAQAAGLKIYPDIPLNHLAGADEAERVNVLKVNPENRNEKISEPFEIEAFTKFLFPGRKGKYSKFVWDHRCFTGVDYAYDKQETAIYSIMNEYGDNWEEVIDDEKGNYDYLMYNDIEFRNPAVREELFQWALWYYNEIGFDGVRLDAVKHISPAFYREWLDYLRETFQKDFFTVAEYWSNDVKYLHEYLDAMENRVQAFDVPLHHNLYEASKMGKDYNLPDIFNNTLVQTRSQNAITFVDNHDTQPTQALESFVEYWFKPHANALILLRQEGIPCVFYPSYYGASYNGNGHDIDLAPVPNLYKMMMIRKNLFEGEQCDYFDHPNVISWFVSGTEQNRNAGFVVMLSNSDDGFKEMNLGSLNANRKFIDVTESFADAVITNDEGVAIFPVKSRSISIWIKEEALDAVK